MKPTNIGFSKEKRCQGQGMNLASDKPGNGLTSVTLRKLLNLTEFQLCYILNRLTVPL